MVVFIKAYGGIVYSVESFDNETDAVAAMIEWIASLSFEAEDNDGWVFNNNNLVANVKMISEQCFPLF